MSVLAQCLGPECRDPSCSGSLGEFIKQQGTDSVVLILVGDYERHLCFAVPRLGVKTSDHAIKRPSISATSASRLM